jgi:DnaK suppressor protein
MTRKETLATMYEVLKQRQKALVSALNGDDSLLKEMNQQSGGDVVDFASDSSFGEISSQLVEVTSRELANVNHALKMMNAGEYGKCEDCGTNIATVRLQALPYATNCIDCQRENEKSGQSRHRTTDWNRVLDSAADDYRLGDMDVNLS